ncbi:single-stranded DNA-binding protein [Enterococcus hirae 88-15-E09]|nr:single-stranded DNA-binding protein [Enterococcus hirae 81-15-F4]OWW58581.1 single-stranded DNA-binding protein [Enterococcus hirae 88-15-E09]
MINNVVLVGRLTKDPDIRNTQQGTEIASFTLAVNRNFKDQNGNREADFINCVAWRKTAELIRNHVSKGQQIGVVGRVQTRSYDNQQGQKVFVTEVIVSEIQFLESKVNNNQTNNNSSDPFGATSIDISDDDLPFN